ncbi:MAG: guanylate kinase [Candidatus Firestonebacteria bacterium]|nr:guanylate kinase [Candidatus Firestonebacteria bacterium]
MTQQGLIIVISAPSGAGKTSICRKLISLTPSLVHSVSVSTRKPREGEKDGIDYFFTTEESFFKRRAENEFVEWAFVHGNYYGTPKKFMEESIKNGNDVLLEIDVVGALKVKESNPDSILIFILPQSMAVLEARLRERKTDDEEIIKKRLINAENEIKYIDKYNYIIKNIDLNKAVDDVKSIIRAEKCNIKRFKLNSHKLID